MSATQTRPAAAKPAAILEDSAAQPHGKTPWHMHAWRAMDMRIGLIPLPIYLLLAALVGGFIAQGKVPTDISVSIAVLCLGGLQLCRIRQTVAGAETHRRGRHLRHVRAVAAGLPACDSTGAVEERVGIHQEQ